MEDEPFDNAEVPLRLRMRSAYPGNVYGDYLGCESAQKLIAQYEAEMAAKSLGHTALDVKPDAAKPAVDF